MHSRVHCTIPFSIHVYSKTHLHDLLAGHYTGNRQSTLEHTRISSRLLKNKRIKRRDTANIRVEYRGGNYHMQTANDGSDGKRQCYNSSPPKGSGGIRDSSDATGIDTARARQKAVKYSE